jgi:hypothetical protein
LPHVIRSSAVERPQRQGDNTTSKRISNAIHIIASASSGVGCSSAEGAADASNDYRNGD